MTTIEERGTYLMATREYQYWPEQEEEHLYWREEDDIDLVRAQLFPGIKDIVTYCIDVYENESMSSCPICLENKRTIDMVTTNCFHQFCFNCILEHVETLQKTQHVPCCPLCRENYKSFEIRDMEKCIRLDTLCRQNK